MRDPILGFSLGLCALATLACAAPARAFDCARARLPAETALCADPAAKAADAAMEAAFNGLRDGLGAEARRAALDDQRAWLKRRDEACADRGAAMGRCLAEADAARTRALTGQAEAGPGLDRRPVPVFVRRAGGPGHIDVAVRVYRFPDPRTPLERTVNAEADRALAAIPFQPDEPTDSPNLGYEEIWTIASATPRLISIQRDSYAYSGGAHGSSGTLGLTVDAAGRIPTFADLFAQPAAAAFAALCLEAIKAERAERGVEPEPDPDLIGKIRPVVADLRNWVLTGSGATVHFDRYAVGSYAEGSYECPLPAARLDRASRVPLR